MGLFLVTELVPFFVALDYQLLSLIANERQRPGDANAATTPHVAYTSHYGSVPTNSSDINGDGIQDNLTAVTEQPSVESRV